MILVSRCSTAQNKFDSCHYISVCSGHEDFQSLFATNDQVTPSFIVNRLGAPNQSTVMVRECWPWIFKTFLFQCGCENTSCPFCNLVESIRNRDPDSDLPWVLSDWLMNTFVIRIFYWQGLKSWVNKLEPVTLCIKIML